MIAIRRSTSWAVIAATPLPGAAAAGCDREGRRRDEGVPGQATVRPGHGKLEYLGLPLKRRLQVVEVQLVAVLAHHLAEILPGNAPGINAVGPGVVGPVPERVF